MAYSICLIKKVPFQCFPVYEMEDFHSDVFSSNVWLSEFNQFYRMKEFYGADSEVSYNREEIKKLRLEINDIIKRANKLELNIFCKIMLVICEEALSRDMIIETGGD